ncbi:hypothetical protein BP5796_04632 [Coleophoma crateriformis]|uniref:BTB domain-containing protein n=1 Tax=Coleophoma crateriformis TaxID=565419 RepID=A0A3D8SAH3_9HELO|nr:hypothetical protein BP5796_04632 [Coleophoma crateriformis]
MATLIVGPDNHRILCPRPLLGYHSEFFDAALYGSFSAAHSGEVQMPDEDVKDIMVFINWIYSGTVIITDENEVTKYWLLGERLLSPRFANEVMYSIFNKFLRVHAEPKFCENCYAGTIPGCKLRQFARDLITFNPPALPQGQDVNFCAFLAANVVSAQAAHEWWEIIRKGGDLVLDVCTRGSFTHLPGHLYRPTPCAPVNHHRYLLPITTRPIEEFLEGRSRTTLH